MTHPTSQPIVIYGAGGHARETAWLIQAINHSRPMHVACFADDDERAYGAVLNDTPVTSLADARARFPDALITIAIGNSRTRLRLADRAAQLGFGTASLIHPSVHTSSWNQFGEGLAICAGSVVTTNVTLGRHAQINVGCTVSHDVVAGDFLTLAPGVHISGCVRFGHRVQVGTGATFVNGTLSRPLIVGDDAVIGAGACVVRDVPPAVTVVGVPARVLAARD